MAWSNQYALSPRLSNSLDAGSADWRAAESVQAHHTESPGAAQCSKAGTLATACPVAKARKCFGLLLVNALLPPKRIADYHGEPGSIALRTNHELGGVFSGVNGTIGSRSLGKKGINAAHTLETRPGIYKML